MMRQAGISRSDPFDRPILAVCLVITALAVDVWLRYAPHGVPAVALAYAEIAVAIVAWHELRPASLRRFLDDAGLTLLLCVVLHMAAFVAIMRLIPPSPLSLMPAWYMHGSQLESGLVPYRDFSFEYPPLMAVLFWLPLWLSLHVSGGPGEYRLWFASLIAVFDVAALCGVLVLVGRRVSVFGRVALFLAQPVWLIWAGRTLVVENLDLVPAAILVLALVFFVSEHHTLAWIALGLGAAIKIFPAVVAPLFLIAALATRSKRDLAEDMAIFVLSVLVPTSLVVRGDLPLVGMFIHIQGTRGLEIGSLGASILLVLHLLAAVPLRVGPPSIAVEVAGPAVPAVTASSIPLTVLALALLYLWAWRAWDPARPIPGSLPELARLGTAAVLIFMLANKVLSPQYLLWLFPLLPLVDRRRLPIWSMYGATLVLSGWIYPQNWGAMVGFAPSAIVMLATRNGLLIVMLALLLAPAGAAGTMTGRGDPAARQTYDAKEDQSEALRPSDVHSRLRLIVDKRRAGRSKSRGDRHSEGQGAEPGHS